MKTGINFTSFEVKKIEGFISQRVNITSKVYEAYPGVIVEVKRECVIYKQKEDCTMVKLLTNDASDHLENIVGVCVDI